MPDFKSPIMMITCMLSIIDPEGQRNKYPMLQYSFEGPEIDVKSKPHGNSKSNQPFFRTSTST